jgi:hypothetical protein
MLIFGPFLPTIGRHIISVCGNKFQTLGIPASRQYCSLGSERIVMHGTVSKHAGHVRSAQIRRGTGLRHLSNLHRGCFSHELDGGAAAESRPAKPSTAAAQQVSSAAFSTWMRPGKPLL